MLERSGFDLRQIDGRSMIRLRVRPQNADAAVGALQLPQEPLQWRDGDPAAYWLGPDQWLLTSDTESANDILRQVDSAMSGQIYAATDTSSGSACFAFSGPAARTVLAMGCGIDMYSSEFPPGRCVRTHFANVLLFIVAVDDNRFDLYVDRSYARYLADWFSSAGQDPMTHAPNNHESASSELI